MSIYFGDVRQVGIIVRDVKRAMNAWAHLGVGPFITMDVVFDDFRYYGRPSAAPHVTIALAYSGSMQIELIQQHNDVPSGYRDFLANGREGVQHLGAFFADHASYNAKRAELLDRGFMLVHEGGSRARDMRFAYFASREREGLEFEITEALLPPFDQFWPRLQQAARDWDGKELIARDLQPG